MGSANFEVGEILGARGNTKAKVLRQGGTLYCSVSAAPEEHVGTLSLGLRGVGLKNVDGLFSKSDPFVEVLAKVNRPGSLTWHPVYRSKHIDNDLNPIWPPFEMDLSALCENDMDKPILVRVFDWEKSGKHKTLGQFETNVNSLVAAKTANGAGNHKHVDLSKAFILRGTGSKSRKEYGKVVVTTAIVEGGSSGVTPMQVEANNPYSNSASAPAQRMSLPTPVPVGAFPAQAPPPQRPTFVDYLSGGCELELSIAIDFTGSNGDPRKPGTLHYIHKDDQLNDYEKVLTSVGSILGRYDSNQRFPVFGFGAKYSGVLQNCFQVGPKDELDGLGEVLNAYRHVFKTGLTMSGPTVFAEVIDMAAARARSAQEHARQIGCQKYAILLIITDGAVTDINLTKQSMINASDAPLSIVIVGVGNADFGRMKFLDDFADDNPNQRDIVQFVEFNRHAHDRSQLTKESLDEIPDQVVEYFYDSRGIKPLPAIHGSQISIDASLPDEEDIDLTIDFNEEEEIVLGDTQNLPKYDDTQYGTASHYMVQPVPVPMEPPAASAPYNPASYSNNQNYNNATVYGSGHQQASFSASSSVASYGVPAPGSGGFANALGSPPSANDGHQVFHVQVPPGSYQGQQLQVQNPRTKQYLVVTIPQGLGPGDKFAVPY